MSDTLTENKIGAIAYEIYVDGELLETVNDEQAIEYMHGWDNIVPGLENALAGKKAGDTFDVTVSPEEAYGEYDNDLIEEIPAADFDFDEDIAEELRARAKDALLTSAIATQEHAAEPADDLLEMEGMDKALAYQLAGLGVVTMEDLAEQAIEDIIELEGLDEERAGELIMAARAPWFAEE